MERLLAGHSRAARTVPFRPSIGSPQKGSRKAQRPGGEDFPSRCALSAGVRTAPPASLSPVGVRPGGPGVCNRRLGAPAPRIAGGFCANVLRLARPCGRSRRTRHRRSESVPVTDFVAGPFGRDKVGWRNSRVCASTTAGCARAVRGRTSNSEANLRGALRMSVDVYRCLSPPPLAEILEMRHERLDTRWHRGPAPCRHLDCCLLADHAARG